MGLYLTVNPNVSDKYSILMFILKLMHQIFWLII